MKQQVLLLALSLAALAFSGCGYDRESALKRLKADNPRDQTAAMAEAVRAGDKTMIPQLIDLLESEDEGVRFMAAAALRRLTGQDLGFQFAKEADRPEIVAKWRRWWEAEGGKSAPARPSPPGASNGRPVASRPPA